MPRPKARHTKLQGYGLGGAIVCLMRPAPFEPVSQALGAVEVSLVENFQKYIMMTADDGDSFIAVECEALNYLHGAV